MTSHVTFDSKVAMVTTHEFTFLKEAPIVSATDVNKLEKLQRKFALLKTRLEMRKDSLESDQIENYHDLCQKHLGKASLYKCSLEKRKKIVVTVLEKGALDDHLKNLSSLIASMNSLDIDLKGMSARLQKKP